MGVVALVYGALLLGLLALGPWIDGLMGRVGEMRSEYTVYEQASKYVILLVILVSVRAYGRLRHPIDVATAILTLLFGLALYLGESNMIQDWSQPMFGLVLGVPIMVLLYRAHAHAPLFLMSAGILVIGAGAAVDAVADHRITVGARLLDLITSVPESEEFLEAAGTAVVALAVLLRFLAPVRESAVSDRWATVCMMGATGLIAVGNSFLHYQYSPGTRLRLVAFGFSAAGFVALVWANRRLARTCASLRLVTEGWFYALGFVAFVLLPMVFGRSDGVTSLAFWPPVFVALAGLLYWHHPDRIPNAWPVLPFLPGPE